MEVIKTLEELKAWARTASDPNVVRRCAELEEQVRTLLESQRQALERVRAIETQTAAQWRSARHDLAQPVTVVQTFLELLPSILEDEQFNPETARNPEFWKNSYNRALDAIKSVPQLLRARTPTTA